MRIELDYTRIIPLLINQHRYYLEQVADDATGSHLKDGDIGVIIDSHNSIRGLYASQVLNRSRDATGNREPGKNYSIQSFIPFFFLNSEAMAFLNT